MNESWLEDLLGPRSDGPVFVLPGENAVLTADDMRGLSPAAGCGGFSLKRLSRTAAGLKNYIAELCARGTVLVPASDEVPPQRMAQLSDLFDRCGDVDPGLAVVLTTSGSTGRPKAVELGSDALLAFSANATRSYGIRATDRILVAAMVDGDYFLEEILLTLGSGATGIVLPPDRDVADAGFPDWLAHHGVSVLDLPLTRWRQLALSLGHTGIKLPACVRLLLLGGEPLRMADVLAAREMSGGALDVVNLYGPTETTIVSTTHRIPANAAVGEDAAAVLPIGTPLPGVDCYVVDEDLRAVADGVPGELLIGGLGLARGYVADAAGTAASFVPDKLSGAPGQRLYRTGDRVVRDAGGTYHFLGRLDSQVKIRGFRVEIAEIEAALLCLDTVDLAAVRADADGDGRVRLSAYVLDTAAETAVLRDGLAQLLPSYMIPTGWVRVSQFPLTATGKIDRNALPCTAQSIAQSSMQAPDGVADATRTERLVSELWSSVLGVRRVLPSDNFFHLGGQSREVIQVALLLRDSHQLDVGVVDLLRRPVLRDLAAFIETELSVNSALLRQEESLASSHDRFEADEPHPAA